MKRREIHPEIKILDEAEGLVEYVASDETLDHCREIIRADGWRFTFFRKNAPFVDSHGTYSISQLLGSVVDARVEGKRLIEVVKWAHDVPENKLARIGFAMTKAGHLKAVSVGFKPLHYITDYAEIRAMAEDMGIAPETAAGIRCIYTEQEQMELSACIIGANPAALARAYHAGAINDADLDEVYTQFSDHTERTARAAASAADAVRAQEQQRAWLRKFNETIKS